MRIRKMGNMTKEEIEEAKKLFESIRNFQLDEEIEKVKEESEIKTDDMAAMKGTLG